MLNYSHPINIKLFTSIKRDAIIGFMLFKLVINCTFRQPLVFTSSNLPPFVVGTMLKSAVSQPLSPNSVRPAYIWRPAVPGPSIFSRPVFFQGIFFRAQELKFRPVPRLLPKLPSNVMKDKENKMIAELKEMIKKYGTDGAVNFLRKYDIDLSYTNSTGR